MFSDFPVCDTIQKRHSVRTFDTRPLDGETLGKLTAYAKEAVVVGDEEEADLRVDLPQLVHEGAI